MGAGDDQDRHRAHHGVIGHAEQRPGDRGDRSGTESEPEKPRRGGIRDDVVPGRGVLRFGHQALDTGEGGVVARGGDFDAETGIGGDGASHDRVSGGARHWAGLAGDHGLVHVGAAFPDRAVGRDARAGADEDEVAALQLVGRDASPQLVVFDAFCHVRQQCGQRVERGRRLGEGAHLDPVAQQHDHDQQGELPPEFQLVATIPRVAPQEAMNATVIASPISSIIPG